MVIKGVEFKKRGRWYKQDIKELKGWKKTAKILAKNNPKTVRLIKKR